METKFIGGVARLYDVPRKQIIPDLKGIILQNGDICKLILGENQSLTLWKEHNAYHVRFCDRMRPVTEEQKAENNSLTFFREWQVFDTRAKAIQAFKKMSKLFRQLTVTDLHKGTLFELKSIVGNYYTVGAFPYRHMGEQGDIVFACLDYPTANRQQIHITRECRIVQYYDE